MKIIEVSDGKEIIIELTNQGARGRTGEKGDPGEPGPKGDKGDKGDPGGSVWGYIDGNLSDQTDLYAALGAKADSADLGNLAGKDSVSWETDITDIPETFPPEAHNHDSRYYTEQETDALLADKADSDTLGSMALEDDAPADGKQYARKDGDWAEVQGGSGDAVWGSIFGTLSNQTDLQTALNQKANSADLGDLAEKDKVNWNTDINNVPSAFPPASHSHDDRYYTESEVDTKLSGKANTADLGTMAAIDDAPSTGSEYVRKNGQWAVSSGGGPSGSAAWGTITGSINDQTDLKNALDGKADASGLGDLAGKDTVDWDTDIDDIPSTFPPASHTHDDRYYTETEINAALSAKANTADLGALATKSKVDWDTDIDDVPAAFPPSAHTHDDRYYTETEVDTALSAKADTADLGALASLSSIDYTSNYLTNKPTIPNGALASLNAIDYTSNYLTNKPTLGNLAALDSIDYTGNYITNKPTIPSGALASLDSIDYTGNYLTNKPSLGGIQVRPDYTISTTDLTDGSSSLETGKLYFVYEA